MRSAWLRNLLRTLLRVEQLLRITFVQIRHSQVASRNLLYFRNLISRLVGQKVFYNKYFEDRIFTGLSKASSKSF